MNEYISRKAVYQFAKDHKEKETGAFSKGYNKGLRVMMAAAMDKGAIPSADVRPGAKAYWLDVYQTGACSWAATCSNCRRTNDIPPLCEANFCPSCGAEMRPRPKEET